ncbi:hypothetical protein ACLBR5_22150 [Escherichia coli]
MVRLVWRNQQNEHMRYCGIWCGEMRAIMHGEGVNRTIWGNWRAVINVPSGSVINKDEIEGQTTDISQSMCKTNAAHRFNRT